MKPPPSNEAEAEVEGLLARKHDVLYAMTRDPGYLGTWSGARQWIEDAATLLTSRPANAPVEGLEPVAWRYCYVHPGRPLHWKVRQTPAHSSPATASHVEVIAEPLYTAARASRPTPEAGVEGLLREVRGFVANACDDGLPDLIKNRPEDWREGLGKIDIALIALSRSPGVDDEP